MEKFGAFWCNKGGQKPDPGVTTGNAQEEACVRRTVTDNLIVLGEGLDVQAWGESPGDSSSALQKERKEGEDSWQR